MKRITATAAALFCLAIPALAQNAPAGMIGDTIKTPSGLRYVITRKGTGKHAVAGNVIIAHYHGMFLDGKTFDSSRERNEPFSFTLGQGQVIPGWDEAFSLFHVGDRATLIIPPELAYGNQDRGPIPANSTLVFDVEFLDVKDRSLADELRRVDTTQGFAAALTQYRQLKESGFDGVYVNESQLNALGYAILNEDRAEDAIEIFKLNVAAYPESFNVYDSLGEAYMNAGKREEAITNYRKSLELNPENANATEMLKKLQEK